MLNHLSSFRNTTTLLFVYTYHFIIMGIFLILYNFCKVDRTGISHPIEKKSGAQRRDSNITQDIFFCIKLYIWEE